MSDITLPNGESNPGKAEWPEVYGNDKAIADVVNGNLDNGNLSGAAGITRANLASDAKPIRWYPPAVIASEESRTNTSYGTLGTPDEVQEVVVPEDGLIFIGYHALWKQTVEGAARAAIFLGSNQLKFGGKEAAANADSNQWFGTGQWAMLGTNATANDGAGTVAFRALVQYPLASTDGHTASVVTTGQVLGMGALVPVFAAADTYNISVRFKASSGTVTAKSRKLWVGVLA